MEDREKIDEVIKNLYLDWIKDYCNNQFTGGIPGGVILALDKLMEIDPLQYNLTSEKLSDMSKTYANDGSIPKYILNWLAPYRKLKSL